MPNQELPKDNHITRYCPSTQIHTDGSVDPSAFELRRLNGKVEEYASVNWVEEQNDNFDDAIVELKEAVKVIRTYSHDSALALLNIDEFLQNVFEFSIDNRNLSVLHHASKSNKSHSGIHNLRIDDDIVLELIAEKVMQLFPNSE